MVTVRLDPDGAAYQFYRTGTIQIRGAKTEADLEAAQSWLLDLLDEIGLELPDYSFEQRTAVFMETFDRSLDLERLVLKLGLEQTEYEPEQFLALIYRPPELDVTHLVFSSGKIIIGGTMSEATARGPVEHLASRLD